MASILGVKVDNLTRQEAIARFREMLQGGGQHIITTQNPEFIVTAQHDQEFRAILNRASLALPDGVGLLFAARVLRVPLKERIAGSDFVWDIARLAAEGGHTMYLLGGREEVAAAAAEKLKSKNVKLKIVGAESGPIPTCHPEPSEGSRNSHAGRDSSLRYGSVQNDKNLINRIRNAHSDILLVALGHGKQEKWIAAHLAELPSVKIAMGVGGVFDFLAGRVRRAPRLMRTLGLEWLWRLVREPRRLPRIFRATIIFPWLVLKEKFWKCVSGRGMTPTP